ncbi:hypothetical protein A9Q84_01040 [Halobacteriovorax marinus]|uniref:DUF4430 domain-containing protein n=1 Tax=Halobacteriovorax marinus TaxID=97084 RepID=A0A1Y5FIE9_9BACT|nr:hypothetical protein A9Q84_01040 [Halobacteriovorax marinus]
MKTLILLLPLFSTHTFAVTLEVVGPCSETAVIEVEYDISDLSQSVGFYSVEMFTAFDIPFLGTDGGMNSIINTPTGKKAIEKISETKMRAHGWCYQVDGFEPAAMTNNYFFPTKTSHLRWVFGYSTFDGDIFTGIGEWTGYCDPTYAVKPAQFCQ